MRKILAVFPLILIKAALCCGQSFEFMPGTERMFIDVQWLKAFDAQYKWTLFSRTRVTVDYEENTNLFTGAYLSYTTSSGFGGTLLGRVSSIGSGVDIGPHYTKQTNDFMVYATVSVNMGSPLSYSWFSIMRYRPAIGEKWKLYTSLELFSSFNKDGHAASVQRMRVGVDKSGYQFGLALNLGGKGVRYRNVDSNPGIFIRKEFN